MKKMILTAIVALLVAVPAVQAQKINKDAMLAKIEKCEADASNPKKDTKAATWINLAKAYYEAASAPTKDIFVGMEQAMLNLTMGAPQGAEKQTINGAEYDALTFPYLTVYIKDGKVAFWKQTEFVVNDAVEKALSAYDKAYELDPKSASKMQEGLQQISNFCSQMGNVAIDTNDFVVAANSYALGYRAQTHPAFGAPADNALLYYAGYFLTVDGANNPASYVRGANYLNDAISKGYVDNEGNIYYYLFHCYYGQRAADRESLFKAKDALLEGIAKFPKNARIVEGLIQLYAGEEGVGNPADLVATIDKMLAEQPQNVDLWYGRGRIFYTLKNYDESIVSFKKVAELKPEMFEAHYFLGVFYVMKAEELLKELNAKQYTSQAAYEEDLKAVNALYKEAVPWFENAHKIDPNDSNTLDYLKSICFRFRYDDSELAKKYETYNELFKKAKGE